MIEDMTEIYDFVIAGGGIAGLYTAYNLKKKYPSASVCIVELSNRLGGRLHTINPEPNIYFEAGGARFNNEQKRINKLIDELGLTNKKFPISSSSIYKAIQPNYNAELETIYPTINHFIKDCENLIKQKHIPETELINTTLLEFSYKYYSKQYPSIKNYLIAIYPYYSELGILNTKEGIHLFTNEFSNKTQYYVLNGGLQQLTDTIINILKNNSNSKSKSKSKYKSNLNILLETELINIELDKLGYYNIITSQTKSQFHIGAYNIILAIPKNGLSRIKYLTRIPKISKMINSISLQPLYRIYACYPPTKSSDKSQYKTWFDGLSKITTNLEIKYIIPIDYKNGIIMISYTDSKFAKYWLNHVVNGTFEKELYKQLKLLFPDKDIPEKPKWFKHYYWDIGAGYWKPGFDKDKILKSILKPISGENIFICGENYSSHQAWVEGALETADLVLEKIYSSYPLTAQGFKNPYIVGYTDSGENLKVSTYIPSQRIGVKTPIGRLRDKHKKSQKQKQFYNRTKINKLSGGKKQELKKYTLEEVKKHNTKNDAWIIINGIVANITEWIPKHPGGMVIMKGVGKDATQLFKNIGHSSYALKMLKKYQIGILAK